MSCCEGAGPDVDSGRRQRVIFLVARSTQHRHLGVQSHGKFDRRVAQAELCLLKVGCRFADPRCNRSRQLRRRVDNLVRVSV